MANRIEDLTKEVRCLKRLFDTKEVIQSDRFKYIYCMLVFLTASHIYFVGTRSIMD